MSWWQSFKSLFRRTPARRESYCNQPVIATYEDYQEIGEWGKMDCATGEQFDGGKMLSRTVKFRATDGTIQLGREWVADFEVDQ